MKKMAWALIVLFSVGFAGAALAGPGTNNGANGGGTGASGGGQGQGADRNNDNGRF
jgi:hypothetical protein